jgi:hypothetical protein
MRAHFIRGEDPMDAMNLGDVRGRKLKRIADILVKEFEKLIENSIQTYFKPKFEIEYREINQGFANRGQWETDAIDVNLEYKEYYFSLNWVGNPLNEEVPQKFVAKWAKVARGASDMSTYRNLDPAVSKLKGWIENI